MIVAQDETQQNAEFRQAFLKHLPKRVEIVLKRGRRLARSWDINAFALMHQDVQGLAGACGRYGLLDLGDRFFGLENFLSPFVKEYRQPEAEHANQFALLLDELSPVAEREMERLGLGLVLAVQNRHADMPQLGRKIQTSVIPPLDFISRYAKVPPLTTFQRQTNPSLADDFNAAIKSTSSASKARIESHESPSYPQVEIATAPAPEAHASPSAVSSASSIVRREVLRVAAESNIGPQRIYHLSDGSVFSRDLGAAIEKRAFLLETLETPEELIEMIGALAPHAAIVDAKFLNILGEHGPNLKAIRQKINHRIVFVVLADSSEVSTRLKAMRIGADVFIPNPNSISEVLERICESLETDIAEPYRVMIIEDDRSQALFAEQILRKAGMQPRAVMDPLSALDQLDQFRPELILMDLYMPGCDGMELTALIREREAFVATPIVFLSGEHDTDKRFDALSAGGDDYLEKPIRPKYLIASVSSRVQRARALARRAHSQNPRDSVSGMIERGILLEHISGKIANEETHGQSGSVLFLIADGAQTVRETAGLMSFDSLMAQAGAFIASLIGEGEHCARYGDTSFLVLSPYRSDDDVLALGQTLIEQFSKHIFDLDQRSTSLNLSVGIAPFSHGWSDAGSVINASERAASTARNATHKLYVHQAQVTQAQAGDEGSIANLVRDALKFDQFQLVFQPIASLRGSADEQFQAFLRLPAPGGRLFTASAIIPAAENAGIIHGVDRWTTARCLMVVQDRLRQGRPVTLFAPHSIESANDPQRGIWLKQQLESRRVPGANLIIEFLAQDALVKVKQIAHFAEQIKELGVRICLSHFDANMSAYQLLQHMRIDFIKISSRYLVNDSNTKSKSEFRKLIDFARDQQIGIVATRVEDAQTAAMLWSSGVDFIQGNFVQQTTQDLEFDFRASSL